MAFKIFCTDYGQLAQLNGHLAAGVLARSALLKMWMRFSSSFTARRTDLSSIFLLVKFPDNLESLAQLMRIIHGGLSLKCLKRQRAQELTAANQAACLQHAGQLLQHFSDSDIDFIWFTDEKIFIVAPTSNMQNDHLYKPHSLRKKNISARRPLHMHATFSQSLTVSVGASKLGLRFEVLVILPVSYSKF